jgi:hypothetical protein
MFLLMNERVLFLQRDGSFGSIDSAIALSSLTAAALSFVYGDCIAFQILTPSGYPTARVSPSLS